MIIEKGKKEGVYIGMTKRDEKGFTLMEVLVSFSVVLMITAFLPILFQAVHTFIKEEKGVHPLELEVFTQQAKNEIRTAKSVTSTGKILTIRNANNQNVTYEKYQGNIRRRVNGTGHEILLQNIKDVVFVQERNGATIYITGAGEDFYEVGIYAILKDWPAGE
ncbi:prepilin-type N-terminal cleavage/methylation domain-containing protein [Bacillus tianshenii]|uniref:competence type IV pilus minor pilin ComGF n=1 Tax=Sutcliffiella tianshenii TaxID=1463404 RepID=UPI001CD4A196|nr:competence type IV pilus minor pilin ComGF [Bacillus tianshenii]MCA1320537.1 prepilin-type N-terminal cleavage/methylation domain-containing protein [Bacillus tianshenii]